MPVQVLRVKCTRYSIIRCVQNIISSILLLYCGPISRPPDLCLYKCKEFSVHGTMSSVVFQNIIITAVFDTRFALPDFCLYKCEELEFRLSSKLLTELAMEKENICCILDGINNDGHSLHYIGVWSADLSNVGLLNIDNTASVNREKVYLVFLFMAAAWQTILKLIC